MTSTRSTVAPAQSRVSSIETEQAAQISRNFQSANPKHRIEMHQVTIDDVFLIDPAIQRGEVEAEIAAFASKFNPLALGTLTISVREQHDGTGRKVVWSVVDGQQRLAASRRVGYKQPIAAVFHFGLSLDEEAQLFLDLNERRGVTALVRFKTRVTAGEPSAVAIKMILDDLGIPSGSTYHGFTAISTADKIVNQINGRAKLRWALETIKRIYDNDGKANCYRGEVVEAFALLFEDYGTMLDVTRLVEKLSVDGGGVHTLVGRGRTVQQVVPGLKISEGIEEAIVTLYNKGKRTNPAYPSRLAPPPRRRKQTTKVAKAKAKGNLGEVTRSGLTATM